ncbi:MAG: hypothetical protein OQK29_06650 [Ignavibacteriaceae bacterium]|nr:hypothetical protein [Ignavibacteriaceae bacterium]
MTLTQLIEDCLNNPECFTSAEIEFIQAVDESMMMPSEKDVQILKRLWHKLELQKAA